VDGSLAVNLEGTPQGSVLLVEDMVDSHWTLTVAAYLLQVHGSGQVYPLALADTGHGDEGILKKKRKPAGYVLVSEKQDKLFKTL
jgi:phosphoribosylpyrophosphate synthetase